MRINLPTLYTQIGNPTPIGNSTIAAIGCLTVDAAMASTYFGHPIDPSTLAKRVTYSGNLWIWGQLSALFPDIKYTKPVHATDIPTDLTDAQMNEIRSAINEGWPVFIKISTKDFGGTISEHWVLGVDYNGDDIMVADPLTNPPRVHPITDFGIAPKKVIYAYGWYTGNKPAVNPINEWQTKLQAYNNTFYKPEDAIAYMDARKKEISDKDRIIGEKDKKLGQINALSVQITQISKV